MKNNFNLSYYINSPNKNSLNHLDIKKYNSPKIKDNFYRLNNYNNKNNDIYNNIKFQTFEENISNKKKKSKNKNNFEKNSKISNKNNNDYNLYNDIFNKITNLKNKSLKSSSEKSFSNEEHFHFSKSNNHNSSKIKIKNMLNNAYSKTLENDNNIIKNLEKNFDDFFNKQYNLKKNNQISHTNKNSKILIQKYLVDNSNINNKEKNQRNKNFILNNNKTFDKNQIKILAFKKFNKKHKNERNQNLTLETENSKNSKQNSFQQKRIKSKENIKNNIKNYSPKNTNKKPLIIKKYFNDNYEDPYKIIEILIEENTRLNKELTKFKKLSYKQNKENSNFQNMIKNLISKINFISKNYNEINKICKNEINIEYFCYKNNSLDKEFHLFLKENKNLDTNKLNYKKLFENTDKTIHNIEVENKYLFIKTKKLKKLIDDFIIDKENNFSYTNNNTTLNNTDNENNNNIKVNKNILNQREYFYFNN